MAWQNVTAIRELNAGSKHEVWLLESGELRLTVYRLTPASNPRWLCACNLLGFYDQPIKAQTIELARARAIKLARARGLAIFRMTRDLAKIERSPA